MNQVSDGAQVRAVEWWLHGVLALVAAMVVLGGLTRLTGSGLSIVRWDLVSGVLPPLSHAAWEEAFRLYRQIPEFTEQNSWMQLEDFRSIYWWEWAHRFLGRVVGVAYAVPLLFFVLLRRIPRPLLGRLLLLLLLGTLQGAIGWWMVRSGLAERVDVSPYRLAVHLGMAFAIMGLLLEAAMRLRSRPPARSQLDPLLGIAVPASDCRSVRGGHGGRARIHRLAADERRGAAAGGIRLAAGLAQRLRESCTGAVRAPIARLPRSGGCARVDIPQGGSDPIAAVDPSSR